MVHRCVAIGARSVFGFYCGLVQYGVVIGLHDLLETVLSTRMPVKAVVDSQTIQVVECPFPISGTVICGWDLAICFVYRAIG